MRHQNADHRKKNKKIGTETKTAERGEKGAVIVFYGQQWQFQFRKDKAKSLAAGKGRRVARSSKYTLCLAETNHQVFSTGSAHRHTNKAASYIPSPVLRRERGSEVCTYYLFLVESLVEHVELDGQVLGKVLNLHRGLVLDSSPGQVLHRENGCLHATLHRKREREGGGKGDGTVAGRVINGGPFSVMTKTKPPGRNESWPVGREATRK